MLVRDAYKMDDVRSTTIRTCNCYCYLILIAVIILCDYYFMWESSRKDFYRNTSIKWYIIGLVFVHNDNHPLVMTTSATLPMHEVLWREVVWGLSRSLSCSLRETLSLCEGIVQTSVMVLCIPFCRIIWNRFRGLQYMLRWSLIYTALRIPLWTTGFIRLMLPLWMASVIGRRIPMAL
jgi:hypothetical protein